MDKVESILKQKKLKKVRLMTFDGYIRMVLYFKIKNHMISEDLLMQRFVFVLSIYVRWIYSELLN